MDVFKNIFNVNTIFKELGFSDELITIYKKQKNYRTSKDNLHLMVANECLECFQTILKSNEGLLKYETIMKNIDFAIYQPGRVIYYPKDVVTNMFYIFFGNVLIDRDYEGKPSAIKKSKSKNIKNDTSSQEKPEEEKKKENTNINTNTNTNKNTNNDINNIKNLGFFKKMFKALKSHKKKQEKENKKEENDEDDNENILKKGSFYGHEEINMNITRRKYLVKTNTICIIGFLSKNDYKLIFERTDILKRNDMLFFLKNIKILKGINNEVVFNHLLNIIKERIINRGEPLIKKGEELNKVFIIRKGYFQINLNVKHKISNMFNDLNYFGHYTNKEKTENIKYELRNYYFNEEKYKIITYGQGEVIGDIEFYFDSKKFLTNIFCNHDNSIIYEIEYQHFDIKSLKIVKELIFKEAIKKLEQFKGRVNEIKLVYSKKISNKNKFKDIIWNKLEEEKGEIFKKMEKSKHSTDKYEKKQRKKLKSAKVNNNLRSIFENRLFLQTEGRTRNKCMSFEKNDNKKLLKRKFTNSNKDFENFFKKDKNNIFTRFNNNNSNKSKEEEKFAFHTSVKNKSFRFIKHYTEVRNKDKNIKRMKIGANTPSLRNLNINPDSKDSNNNFKLTKIQDKAISFLFNNIEHNLKNSHDNFHFKRTVARKITDIKDIKNENTEFLSLKNDTVTNNNNNNINKSFVSKGIVPTTPNEKFQYMLTHLFSNKKTKKNESLEELDSAINNNNNFCTQESTLRKTNDHSKYSVNNYTPKIRNNSLHWQNNDSRRLLNAKEDEKYTINSNRKLSLLSEIIKDKKNIFRKRLSSFKNKNYNSSTKNTFKK